MLRALCGKYYDQHPCIPIYGPCHPAEIRKLFWTDVLKSLELSIELLFEEARFQNARIKEWLPEEYIEDLAERIEEIRRTLY